MNAIWFAVTYVVHAFSAARSEPCSIDITAARIAVRCALCSCAFADHELNARRSDRRVSALQARCMLTHRAAVPLQLFHALRTSRPSGLNDLAATIMTRRASDASSTYAPHVFRAARSEPCSIDITAIWIVSLRPRLCTACSAHALKARSTSRHRSDATARYNACCLSAPASQLLTAMRMRRDCGLKVCTTLINSFSTRRRVPEASIHEFNAARSVACSMEATTAFIRFLALSRAEDRSDHVCIALKTFRWNMALAARRMACSRHLPTTACSLQALKQRRSARRRMAFAARSSIPHSYVASDQRFNALRTSRCSGCSASSARRKSCTDLPRTCRRRSHAFSAARVFA